MGDGLFIRVDVGPQFINYELKLDPKRTPVPTGPFMDRAEFGVAFGVGTFFGSHPDRRYLITAMIMPRFNRPEVLTRFALKIGMLW